MSKHRYGSVEFKRVDWSGLAEELGGGRGVLAVDVAKQDFVAAVLGPDAVVRVTFRWQHPGQTAEVLGYLGQLAGAVALEAVLEPSGTYGDALIGQLRRIGIALYRVSPKRVHDAAEVYDGVPSLHDAKAAELIGRLHLQGVSQVWEVLGEERRELNAWLTRLEVSKARHQAEINRLEAHLSRHWPELLSLLELGSATLGELVAAYGDPAAVAADPAGAEALMRRVGRAGLSEESIAAVLASACTSLGLPCLADERGLLQWLAANSNATRRELHAIEQEIERRVATSAGPARLAGVIGKVSAAVLVAAVGEPQTYPDAASYTKAIGLNLKERSSGKHKGQLKITKRGPSVARFYLYFAALRLIARDPEVRRWYDRQNARPGALKGKTIVALMRKLAQALWHVGRGATFEVKRLFAPAPLPA
jgi:transposase